MVLPASAADEGQAGRPAWLERIRGILELGREGVLVLIPDAKLPQLLPLMRTLWTSDASARVIVDARELSRCEVGALVVLALQERDATWLNRNRPIVAQRKLRVVLWGEESLVEAMLGRAPDFFDWVSHVIECPFGVPAFTVRGLRAGIEWGRISWGGGLDLRAVLRHLRWSYQELPSGALKLDSWVTQTKTGLAPEILEAPAGVDGWFPVDAQQVGPARLDPWNLEVAILLECELAAIPLLSQTTASSLREVADTDEYLLNRARHFSKSWPQLRAQALQMRTSGPLVRALFKSERAAFEASARHVPGRNETE